MQKISILTAVMALSASGAYAASTPGSANVAADSQGAAARSAARHAQFNKWLKKTANFKPLFELPNLSDHSESALKVLVNKTPVIGMNRAENQNLSATIWKPQRQTVSYLLSFGWMTGYEYTFTYNDKGLLVTSLCDTFMHQKLRQTAEWNENDKPVLITSEMANEGGDFENYQQNQYAYDTKVTDFFTLNQVSSWKYSAWWPSDESYKNFITRDDAGNVVGMDTWDYVTTDYQPETRMTIEYGTDGRASEIDIEEYEGTDTAGNPRWEYEEVYTDIEWFETDGQILQTDNLFQGPNRIKSASIQDEESIGTLEVDYTDNGSFTATYILDNEVSGEHMVGIVSSEVLDEYGSYKQTVSAVYTYDDIEVEKMEQEQTMMYDEQGTLIMQEILVKENDEIEEWQKVIGEPEYDPTYGYPVSYLVSLCDKDTGEPEPIQLTEYSDYIGFSGIEEVNASTTEASVVYYDMQGRRVANPVKGGIYIRRTGGSAEKIIIR